MLSSIEQGENCTMTTVASDSYHKTKLEELPLYSYETLASATESFHDKNKLGQGGFGPVYKVSHITCKIHVMAN